MMSVASRDIKLLLHEESNRIDDLLAKSPIGPGKRAIFKKFFESYEDSADEAGDAEAVEKGYDGDVENEEVEVTRKKSSEFKPQLPSSNSSSFQQHETTFVTAFTPPPHRNSHRIPNPISVLSGSA